jgi:hypothetical protein
VGQIDLDELGPLRRQSPVWLKRAIAGVLGVGITGFVVWGLLTGGMVYARWAKAELERQRARATEPAPPVAPGTPVEVHFLPQAEPRKGMPAR